MKKNLFFLISILLYVKNIMPMDQPKPSTMSYDQYAQLQNKLREQRNQEDFEKQTTQLYPDYDQDASICSLILYFCYAECLQKTQDHYRFFYKLIEQYCPVKKLLVKPEQSLITDEQR